MIISDLYRRQRLRIGTLCILVMQLETVGFVQELCHYSRRNALLVYNGLKLEFRHTIAIHFGIEVVSRVF